jgi:predicted nucleotidyltransferase
MRPKNNAYYLNENELDAVNNLMESLRVEWPQVLFKIFGSKVNGTSDEESDIDLLIIFPCTVTEEIRKNIIHKIFKINLDYESNISALIVSRDEWENGRFTVLPIHETIESEGVLL